MKTNLLLGLCLALFLAGCASTPTTNWDQRVGSLTYDQAVAELGEPVADMRRPDGSRDVTWLAERGSPQKATFGMGDSAVPGGAPPPVRPEFPSRPDRFLHLFFGPDGRLTSWQDDSKPRR